MSVSVPKVRVFKSGKKLTPVIAEPAEQSVQMAESISVPRVEMTDNVCIDCGLISTCVNSVMVPIGEVEQYLQTHKNAYERTWPVNRTTPGGKAKHLDWEGLSERAMNRMYIDLDGDAPPKMTEPEFNKLVSDIEDGLRMAFSTQPCSAMKACMWKCFDNKGKSTNKLSFRVQLTKLHGNKDECETFARRVVLPLLLNQFENVIPVSWGTDKKNPHTLKLD